MAHDGRGKRQKAKVSQKLKVEPGIAFLLFDFCRLP
jgi:hypothetical protein